MPNILIIEDEEFICKLISKIASKKSYNIFIANNPKKAIELIEVENDYRFVFLDYNMNKDNLSSIIKKIKDKNKNCTIVIMSGLTEDEIDIDVNYDKFIHKLDLVDEINNIL